MTTLHDNAHYMPTNEVTMRRIGLAGALTLAAVLLTGCGGGKWDGKNCSTEGNTTVCVVEKANGKECETTLERLSFGSDRQTTTCADKSNALECSEDHGGNGDANASGNICRVPVGDGRYCVAVLPDGGKAPKGYKDFTTCPEATDA